MSVEEVPLIQADVTYGDILRDGQLTHSPRPSLLAITMLPPNQKSKNPGRPITPPIPPHPSIVQRRMELLTSDMLLRALNLIARGQPERAQHLLTETRSILKGLGKGGLPPLPPGADPKQGAAETASSNNNNNNGSSAGNSNNHNNNTTPTTTTATLGGGANSPSSPAPPQLSASDLSVPERDQSTTPTSASASDGTTTGLASNPVAAATAAAAVDASLMAALDAEVEAALEWVGHPAVFGRDSRKAVLQAIGVISSQRGYTFRSLAESQWAERVVGIRRLIERAREWRAAVGDESLAEE